MKAVLGKDKKPKKGDVVQFGTYDDQPIKWKVINVSPYEHKALLIADSYCGEVTPKDYLMGKIYGMITDLMEECFFPDEQELICEIRLLTDDDCQIFSIEKDELKFFSFGEDNEASEWWCHIRSFVDEVGSWELFDEIMRMCVSGNLPTTIKLFLRPVMWIKYDCAPAEKNTGEEQEKK